MKGCPEIWEIGLSNGVHVNNREMFEVGLKSRLVDL